MSRTSVLASLARHPVVRVLSVPLLPWSRAIAAVDAASFWPAFALALAASLALFEAAARLPVDYRELSLATSADVAKRLARLRSGRGSISGSRARRGTLGRRVPWIFGRSPSGAVAWLGCAAILRRSHGTLLFAFVVAAGGTLLALKLFEDPLEGALFLAILETVYLCSGLRFDFRGSLDSMEVLLAWPVRPRDLFLATILPEALLVSLLVSGSIVARSALSGWMPPEVGVVVATAPLACTLWLALDNMVFLLYPVRFVPGQTSAMQHSGRALVLLALRLAVLGVVGAAGAGAAVGAGWVASRAGLSAGAAMAAGVVAALAVGLGALAVVVVSGGRALARFDVARARATAG